MGSEIIDAKLNISKILCANANICLLSTDKSLLLSLHINKLVSYAVVFLVLTSLVGIQAAKLKWSLDLVVIFILFFIFCFSVNFFVLFLHSSNPLCIDKISTLFTDDLDNMVCISGSYHRMPNIS